MLPATRRIVAARVGGVAQAIPPSVDKLSAWELLAPEGDPYCWFDPQERDTAEWLDRHGLALRSVRTAPGGRFRTPDAVTSTLETTVELKAAGPITVMSRIRSGSGQSRMVVVDGRSRGVTVDDAEAGLQRALAAFGVGLDEVLIIVAENTAVGWIRG